MTSKTRTLGSFAVAMISVSAILNLRGLPIMAAQGMHAIFFYLLGAIGFLLPSALVCAELASHYPEDGGIYCWVRRAFGMKTGFVAMWMEWINNVIAFPASISSIFATFAIAFDPSLLNHPLILFFSILAILWGLSFFNFLGIRITSRLNIIGALFGTIVPGLVILALGLWDWHAHGFQTQAWSHGPLMPHLSGGSLAVFVSVLGAFSGMQITAFYARSIRNPQKTFPRAILLATIIVLFLSIAGVLAIDLVIPPQNLNIVAGVMQCFHQFFIAVHAPFLSDILALLLILGMLASLSAWISGPARGFQISLTDMKMSPSLVKTNARAVPIKVLILQAIVASLLTLMFVCFHSTAQAFWILIALTSQFTVLMYCLVFASALRLRIQRKIQSGTGYKIPGGLIGVGLVTGLGILSCVAAFLFGMNPPSSLHWQSPDSYRFTLMLTDLCIIALPFVILTHQRKKNKK